MKAIITLTLCVLAFLAGAQHKKKADALYKLYKNNEYDAVIAKGKKQLQEAADLQVSDLMGRSYMWKGEYDTAFMIFSENLQADKDRGWISAWAHFYLGELQYIRGNDSAAKAEAEQVIVLNKTANSVKRATDFLKLTGLTEYYDNWYIVATEHLIFHFQNRNSIKDLESYIAQHEQAYININKTFDAQLSKKIDLFVWDTIKIQTYLGRRTGFTRPFYCLSHIHPGQTKGHEMAHSLTYFAWGTMLLKGNQFINEGLATAYDQRNDDKVQNAISILKFQDIKTVKDIWTHPEKYSNEIVYQVGAAFVQYLEKNISQEQFRLIVKTQDISFARKLLGKDFNSIIRNFDDLMSLHSRL